jgi:hypothetical protein
LGQWVLGEVVQAEQGIYPAQQEISHLEMWPETGRVKLFVLVIALLE